MRSKYSRNDVSQGQFLQQEILIRLFKSTNENRKIKMLLKNKF